MCSFHTKNSYDINGFDGGGSDALGHRILVPRQYGMFKIDLQIIRRLNILHSNFSSSKLFQPSQKSSNCPFKP